MIYIEIKNKNKEKIIEFEVNESYGTTFISGNQRIKFDVLIEELFLKKKDNGAGTNS